MNTLKAQYANDIFTTEPEAISGSMDLGLDGVTHVSDYNGQAVFMPAESHEAYLAYYSGKELEEEGEYQEEPEGPSVDRLEALRVIVQEILKSRTTEMKSYGEITKLDDDERIVYGYASVVTHKGKLIVDRQGDMIEPGTMEKAATEFMLGARNGMTMHKGEPTTTIVHSMPFTKEIQDAFGITSDYEGWMIAVKVHDEETWARVKAGEFTGFSIGGQAISEEV